MRGELTLVGRGRVCFFLLEWNGPCLYVRAGEWAVLMYWAIGWKLLGAQSVLAVFLFFIFLFYKNIFSIWKFTGIYPGCSAAGRPGPGRPTAGRQGHF